MSLFLFIWRQTATPTDRQSSCLDTHTCPVGGLLTSYPSWGGRPTYLPIYLSPSICGYVAVSECIYVWTCIFICVSISSWISVFVYLLVSILIYRSFTMYVGTSFGEMQRIEREERERKRRERTRERKRGVIDWLISVWWVCVVRFLFLKAFSRFASFLVLSIFLFPLHSSFSFSFVSDGLVSAFLLFRFWSLSH